MRIRWGREKESGTSEASPAPVTATQPTAKPAVSGSGVAPVQRARTRRAPAPSNATPAVHKDLAQVLLEEGTISSGQMEEAQAKQAEDGGFLGQILIDLNYISENSLTSFLAKHCRIPHLSLLDYLIDDEIVSLVPEEICLECRLIPIDKLGRNLTVAMVDPLDADALTRVREHCEGLRIKPILCANSHYQAVIKKVFGRAKDAEPEEARELTAEDFGFGTSKTKKKAPPPKPEPETVIAEAVEVEAVSVEPVEVEAIPVAAIEEAVPVEPVATEVIPAAEVEAVSVEAVEVAPTVTSAAAAGKSVDGDTLLQVFMGDKKLDESVAGVPPAAPAEGGMNSSKIMQEMVDVMRDSMRDTYAVLARRMELFRGLSSEEVAKVFASGMTSEHEAGETIFLKGDHSDELYAVLGGKVDIVDDGRHVATIEPGGILGEMAWISDEPRSASAVALETTCLVTLNDEVFETLISKDAAIQLLMNIVLILTERVRKANEDQTSA